MNGKEAIVNRLFFGESFRPLNPVWRFGVNSCHAPLLLRDDLPVHLERARRELKMKFLRCHGMLSDEMGVVTPDGRFCFDRIFRAIDTLRRIGMEPFLELSDMPDALARGRSAICHYRFRTDPPRDFDAWGNLVGSLAAALVERYGVDAVSDWYFEVWNEPDIAFWNGSRDEYFRLYDVSRRAIKAVSPRLRVGGPATSKTDWIPEFLDHVSQPDRDDPGEPPRVDFLSTHAYPSDLAFLDAAEGEVKLQSADILETLFSRVRQETDRRFGPGFPILAGEWNSSAGPLAWNHDDCNNAAFIVRTMAKLSRFCDGSMYWCVSDIYEECGFHTEPFHGGYGLLTVNDLPKASFHAFRFLAELEGEEVQVAFRTPPPPQVGALAADDGTTVRIVLWNYRAPEAEGETFRFLPPSAGRGEWILPEAGSAYELWRSLGSPAACSEEQLRLLDQASRPEQRNFSAESELELPPGTVCLLQFRR